VGGNFDDGNLVENVDLALKAVIMVASCNNGQHRETRLNGPIFRVSKFDVFLDIIVRIL